MLYMGNCLISVLPNFPHPTILVGLVIRLLRQDLASTPSQSCEDESEILRKLLGQPFRNLDGFYLDSIFSEPD